MRHTLPNILRFISIKMMQPTPLPEKPPSQQPTYLLPPVMYTPYPLFAHVPVQAHCPYCNSEGFTETQKTVGAGTWIVCLGLCAVGCFPCNLATFCMDSCKDTQHICGHCAKVLGKKSII